MPKALRSKRFNMVMTGRESEMLRELSEADGISASDFVRQLIHKAYREQREDGFKGVNERKTR